MAAMHLTPSPAMLSGTGWFFRTRRPSWSQRHYIIRVQSREPVTVLLGCLIQLNRNEPCSAYSMDNTRLRADADAANAAP